MAATGGSPADPVAADVAPSSVYVIALDLGWELAELYNSPHTSSPAAAARHQRDLPAFLPTMSELSPSEQTRLSLARVQLALLRLKPVYVTAGIDPPTVDAANAALERHDVTLLRRELLKLHDELLFGLHVADRNLGECYDLGRGLVYTCKRATTWDEVRAQFQRFRLETLARWLADLSTYLPEHACRAVAISLGIWQEAIPDPGQRSHRGQLALELGSDAEKQVIRELHRQAGLWRNVLTAAKDPEQMLGAGDYVAAVGRLAKRVLRLLFSRRTYFMVPILLAAGGGAIYLILSSDGREINKLVGAIAAGAGALGITAGSVRTAVGRWASRVEEPLWAAEIDIAIGGAITTLRQNFVVRFSQRPSRIAAAIAPARGPDME